MSTRKEENSSQSSGWLDGLGSIYDGAKDFVWGTPTYSLTKNSEGVYNADLFGDGNTATGWQAFTDKGGTIGDSGQLLNADGSAFDMSSIGADVSKLGSTTEGGLGSIFSGETMGKVKDVAGTAGSLFNVYSAVDDIFGSGAKSRKAAERRLEEGFQQNYAMNQMAMDKFREDNAHFKKQRADITASYGA